MAKSTLSSETSGPANSSLHEQLLIDDLDLISSNGIETAVNKSSQIDTENEEFKSPLDGKEDTVENMVRVRFVLFL